MGNLTSVHQLDRTYEPCVRMDDRENSTRSWHFTISNSLSIHETMHGSWALLTLVDHDNPQVPDVDSEEPPASNQLLNDLNQTSCDDSCGGPRHSSSISSDEVAQAIAELESTLEVTMAPAGELKPQPTPSATETPIETDIPKQDSDSSEMKEEPTEPLYSSIHHYSIVHTATHSHLAEMRRKSIKATLVDCLPELVEQIEPEEVARKLYGVAVIDHGDLDRATDQAFPSADRSHELVLLLIRKLHSHPEWFDDVCKVLSNTGVKIISEVRAEILKKFPEEELDVMKSLRGPIGSLHTYASTAGFSKAKAESILRFSKLEKIFKQKGKAGAKSFVKSTLEEKPDLNLLHEACMDEIDASSFDILLAVLQDDDDDINVKDKNGQTPLHVACSSLKPPGQSNSSVNKVQQRMKIECLLKNKARTSIQDKDGNTVLHLATLRNDPEVVSLLLKYSRRSIDRTNKKGNTALHLACGEGLIDVVKVLFDHRANPAVQNIKKERTALHLACVNEHLEVVKEVVNRDPSTLDAFDRKRLTPLHIACRKNSPTLTATLLKFKNCMLNKVDEDNKTPLHYACYLGNLELVNMLLERDHGKVFIDAQDKSGDTLLHVASRANHKLIVKELLSRKADKDIRNLDGKTPAEVAVEFEHNSLAATMLLKKKGWHLSHREKVNKLKRTQMQSTAAAETTVEFGENTEFLSSDESDADETIDHCW